MQSSATTHEKALTFNTRSFGSVFVNKRTYPTGGLKIDLVDENAKPLFVLTVNLPDEAHLLGKDEFFILRLRETAEIIRDAIDSGVFKDTGRASVDFWQARIWKLEQ